MFIVCYSDMNASRQLWAVVLMREERMVGT